MALKLCRCAPEIIFGRQLPSNCLRSAFHRKAGIRAPAINFPTLLATLEVVMAFTEEEFEAWHRAKRQREFRPPPAPHSPPVATCVHCHRDFGISEVTITDEVAICDICNGD